MSMTESEYTNEQLIDFMYDVMDWRDVVDHPMIYAVIKELKERHAYRAIGTVEELKKMKADYAEAIIDWRQYKKIGTIERFRELTEKEKPKKVIIKPWSSARCPCCDCSLSERVGDGYYQHFTSLERCNECNQRLNWE